MNRSKNFTIIEKHYPTHKINFIHGDSNEWLKDSCVYDIAIDDPNYGIGASKPSKKGEFVKQKNGSKLKVNRSNYGQHNWDDEPCPPEYFDLLMSKSKEQIIWGCNFYDYKFGKGRIVWDKLNGENDQMGCEIAYNSLNERADIIYYMWSGMMQGLSASKSVRKALIQQGNKSLNEERIHETQKPLKLCDYILHNYIDSDWKVFDGHGGSGNLAIACHYQELSLDIVEIDKAKFYRMVEHFEKNTIQYRLL